MGKAVHLLVGGRAKRIPIPEGELVIKLETDEGMIVIPLPTSTDQRRRMRNLNRKKRAGPSDSAKQAALEKRAADTLAAKVSERLLFDNLSPAQRPLAVLMFDKMRFRDRKDVEWRPALGKWLAALYIACPEPWRLDWGFLRDWSSNPSTIMNTSKTWDGKSPTMLRRATCRKMLVDRWGEEFGAIAVPSTGKVNGVSRSQLSDFGSNHPFVSIHTGIVDGSLLSRSDVLSRVTEYAEAGVVTTAEVAQATELVGSGLWLGRISIPGE